MPSPADFFKNLLRQGRVCFLEPPLPMAECTAEVRGVLELAFLDYRLNVAGPAIPFDASLSCAAGEFVRQACWFLVNRDEASVLVKSRLIMPRLPTTPAHHLNADLFFRYLPQILRRAQAAQQGDGLAAIIADTLRQWPLSGVLGEIAQKPATDLDFGGHPGLHLLYAERLAANDKPEWMPTGPALEYVDLVWYEAGRPVSPTGPAR